MHPLRPVRSAAFAVFLLGFAPGLPALRAQSAASAPPIWSNHSLQSAEPLFFVKPSGQSRPTADLLLTAGKLLSVRMANGTADFPPSDFAIHGRTIEYLGTAALPVVNEADLIVGTKTERSIANYKDGKRFLLFSERHFYHDLQVVVDYTADERWSGPHPRQQSLPRLERLLASKSPVTFALLGDSISTGANASGVIGVYPYQEPFIEIFAARMRAFAASKITVVNFSVGGKTSKWGIAQVPAVVAAKPDVILIAFGMNDASGRLPAATFKANLQETMDSARRVLPDVEFVLISGMSANPDWDKAGITQHAEYGQVMQALSGPGIAFCDVRSVWDYAAERKGFRSLTGNGVNHPNDFGHRLYADCLTAVVLGDR